MSEFFKQLMSQLNTIWSKLNITQKIIIMATAAISLVGVATMVTWSSLSADNDGYATLFVNIESTDAASVTEALKEMGINYHLENGGRTLTVPQRDLYEVRMEMARQGLPSKGGQGYEIFDKLQLGMTDFVQNLNYQRALEGEISQSIETIQEVDKARVHITIPKPTLFTESQEEASASIVLKLYPGKYLKEPQIRGITHLVASSVEGLHARQVTVLDLHGNMLTKGFADNAMAEQADHNLSLQKAVETHLEKKVLDIFEGLLGPNKAHVKVSAVLNFEQVDKTIESYDPSRKVIRSQQRDDGQVKNSPVVGDEQKEGSITNYEIDKSIARIINSPGSRERVSVSVVVDGNYSTDKDGRSQYIARTDDELAKFTALVKNTIGFQPDKDAAYVTSMQFDRRFLDDERVEMKELEKQEMYKYWGKIGLILLIILFGFVFLKGLAKNIARAMNPPVPKYAGIALEPEEEEIPESIRKQNELLERVELMAKEHPVNIAYLLKSWLHESLVSDNKKKG